MNQPRPESRISSLERRASSIEAGIVELSNDTAEDLKALRNDIKALSEHVDLGFKQAHTFIQDEIADLKAIMATKDEIAAMEGRLLDAIKQLWQQKPGE
ncbi:MAG TPA: hypothetical protein VGL94_12945 [Ktedonobacteraceae bacterium]|jgi:hypothetical protein